MSNQEYENHNVECGLGVAQCSTSFERAKLRDETVAMMLRQNQTFENIVGQLAFEKEQYVNRIMELESIVPRKIVMPDGKVMLWQCLPC